jgi:hypothetical protein
MRREVAALEARGMMAGTAQEAQYGVRQDKVCWLTMGAATAAALPHCRLAISFLGVRRQPCPLSAS